MRSQHWWAIVLAMFTLAATAQPMLPMPPPGAPPPGSAPLPPPGAGTHGHVGRRWTHLPGNPERIVHNRRAYAFHRGRFYLVSDEGYLGITPPLGLRVEDLPHGAERYGRQAARTYYYGGVFYKRVQGGYQVIAQPR